MASDPNDHHKLASDHIKSKYPIKYPITYPITPQIRQTANSSSEKSNRTASRIGIKNTSARTSQNTCYPFGLRVLCETRCTLCAPLTAWFIYIISQVLTIRNFVVFILKTLFFLFSNFPCALQNLIRNLWILCRTEHIWLYFSISPFHRPVSCASVLVKGSASRI